MLASTFFTTAKKLTLWRPTWGSFYQEPNAYPFELAWHVLETFKSLCTHALLILGEVQKVKWCMNKS